MLGESLNAVAISINDRGGRGCFLHHVANSFRNEKMAKCIEKFIN